MRIIDTNYTTNSTSRNDFVDKMKTLEDRSSWETVDCGDIQLKIDENKEFYLSVGHAYLPPYIAENPTVEAVIDYCNGHNVSEDPLSLIEKINKDKGFEETEKYELTDFALSDLIDRARLGTRFRNEAFLKRNIGVLNDALWIGSQNSEDAKIYRIDDTVFAIPSGNYQPLSIASLIETMETELKAKYQNVSFVSGFYCHEIMYVDFAINDPTLIRVYQTALNQVFYKPRIILRMVTSNLGFSGANLYPMLEYSTSPSSDAVIMSLGEKIILMHKGCASIESFKENVADTFSVIENIPQNLSKLNNITIKHPIHCLINLADKCGIPAKAVEPIAQQAANIYSGGTANARQIYLLFSKIVNNIDNKKDQIRISKKIGKGVRILLNNVDDVDIPKIKWITLSNIASDEGQEVFNDLNDVDVNAMEQMSFTEDED